MSVSERGIFTRAFQEYLFDVVYIDTPAEGRMKEIKSRIAEYGPTLACFIYEPLLQGAGGMRMQDPALLDEILASLKSHGVLLVADEVMTGFGRTGRWFAGSYLQQPADIICLSKGLTGGTLALGITATTMGVFGAFLSEDRGKTLFHGHSFTANPIACAAALASMDLLEDPECMRCIQRISARHLQFADSLRSMPAVKNARCLGTVLAFELDSGPDEYTNVVGAQVTQMAFEKGIFLRPLGNTVYLMPPYCISDKELDAIYQFLASFTAKIKRN